MVCHAGFQANPNSIGKKFNTYRALFTGMPRQNNFDFHALYETDTYRANETVDDFITLALSLLSLVCIYKSETFFRHGHVTLLMVPSSDFTFQGVYPVQVSSLHNIKKLKKIKIKPLWNLSVNWKWFSKNRIFVNSQMKCWYQTWEPQWKCFEKISSCFKDIKKFYSCGGGGGGGQGSPVLGIKKPSVSNIYGEIKFEGHMRFL